MDLIRGTQRRGNRLEKRADGEPPWRLSGRQKARGERVGVRECECRRGEPKRDGAAGDERGAQRQRAVQEAGCAESPEQRTASAARQTAVSAANRRARDAQRAKRAEGRRMPARRVETAQRAPQGSLVAKRRPQKQNRDWRHERERRQQHRDIRKMVVLPEKRERLDHWHRRASGGAAAAQCGAEGDALREGDIAAQRSREATGHWLGVKRGRREQGVREREPRQRRRGCGALTCSPTSPGNSTKRKAGAHRRRTMRPACAGGVRPLAGCA